MVESVHTREFYLSFTHKLLLLAFVDKCGSTTLHSSIAPSLHFSYLIYCACTHLTTIFNLYSDYIALAAKRMVTRSIFMRL